MRVIGTFQSNALRNQPDAAQKNSGFAAMLAFNLDRKPGENDVTALFAANSSELKRLYEQNTGKALDNQTGNNTVVVTFSNSNRIIPRTYWAGEFLDDSKPDQDTQDSWLMPLRRLSSNQNMKYAVR